MVDGYDVPDDSYRLSDILQSAADTALNLQRNDGAFPAGQNAHYGDFQTPVRTTCHWLLLMEKVGIHTGKSKYTTAARDATEYLLSEEVRPDEKTFHCLYSKKKPQCNWLVGQAIPIFTLASIGDSIDVPDAMNIAIEVANLHTFDNRLRLWNPVEIDGTTLPFDRTLNHQLAFAASLTQVEHHGLREAVVTFLDSLPRLAGFRDNAIVRHLTRTPWIYYPDRRNWRNVPTSIRNRMLFELYRYSSPTREKEIGYQSVNLFWLSLLKRAAPTHPVWRSIPIENMLEFIISRDYLTTIRSNDLALTNTPTGIHNAIALETFREYLSIPENEIENIIIRWLELQIGMSYDFSNDLMDKHSDDPMLMASTIWKATLLRERLLFDSRSPSEYDERFPK